ncbi:MAG: CinA family nicotinamide mononucleotide deamidase-related protein [Thermoanaerobaculaceae bacterium]|nr:CinA family nicotinamide mononucleotide deamidase-related protein [Thermoanaerobaculaceae bacterium]
MATFRRASFLAVGSELLRTDRLDTNSLLAGRLLAPCGFGFVEKRCVEDDAGAIAAAITEMLARAELVIVSGGLGPTEDDVTREAAARALGIGLARDPRLEAALLARFRARGREFPAIALRMADVLDGAEVLENPVGTAPGQLVLAGRGTLVLLPGVPVELEQILVAHLVPRWAAAHGVVTRTLRLAGVYESQVEERVKHLYERFGRERVTILAARGQVLLVLAAAGERGAQELSEMEAAFAAVAGADLVGRDGETLAGVVLARLAAHGWRLATAESCTGGLVGAAITSEAGSSAAYLGGVVSYSDALKHRLLGVPEAALAAHGAVSREVAEAMAAGARALGAECALAVTGIAGPDGGSEDKPVGTVHIAAATPRGVRHALHRFPGDRAMVREMTANFALDLLRRALEDAG